MQKLQMLIVFLLVTILVAGCTGAKSDSQIHKVGELILNQEGITTIEIYKGTNGQPDMIFSDSKKVFALINKAKEIPVKKLSKSEDTSFMSKRILDDSVLNLMFYSDNTSKTLEGQFFIWPDGYIYSVDVKSMQSNQRTISYLSESKYPEIYELLTTPSKPIN